MENVQNQSSYNPHHNPMTESSDSLFDQCVLCVLDAGQASTSLLQRRFDLKYDQAALIMDELEDKGIIGPYQGATPRKVFYTCEQWISEHPKFAPTQNTRATAYSSYINPMPSSTDNTQQTTGDELQKLWSLKLRISLRTAIRWFFKPIPFLIYLACSVLMSIGLYGIKDGWFWVVEVFIAIGMWYVIFRGVWEIFQILRQWLRLARSGAKQQFSRFKRWNDSFPSARVSTVQDNLPALDVMDGHTFEHFCADLLCQNGFENVEVTPPSGDYGIDILAEKDDITYAIQCKRYTENVGNHAVQEAHSGAAYYDRMVPVVMTNRYFTQAAKETAAQTHVLLWDRDKLLQMMEK